MEIGDIYTHYRNHKLYQIIGIGRHTETLETMVVYKALYFDSKFGNQAIWIRPMTMFLETVESQGQMVPRFTLLSQLPPLTEMPPMN